MTTLDQLIYAIRMQESGGNYTVVNSIGAVGAYQVMKANIPSWTRQALGHSLTWQQYRDNAAAQDAVARYMLGKYYKQYGAAGAAAMWYSGQPNPNKTYGNPPVSTYVQQVMNRTGSYYAGTSGGASVTISGTGSSGGAGATVAKLDPRTMAQMYGIDYNEIQSIPELKKLFNKAVSKDYSADRFTAELKNTNWWKTTSQTQRQYFDLRYSDPATFKSKWDQTAFEANQLAVQAGRGNLLGPGTTMGRMNSLLQSATYKILALGWSTDRVKDWLGAGAGMTKDGQMFGEAGDALDQLHSLAWENGLKYSNSWYKQRAQAVAGGKSTVQYYEEAIRHAAAAKYSAFGQQILAGQNVMDLASPYIQSVQQLMETPGVDVFNKYVSKAMTTKQKDGTPYALWQLEDDVRADPLWRKTKNAQDGTMAVAHQVLQNFGFAF